MEPNVLKVLRVQDKEARMKLMPSKGTMVVQQDAHERYFFDGFSWRLWRPGTKKHWAFAGKPKPQSAPKIIEMVKTAPATTEPAAKLRQKKIASRLLIFLGIIILTLTMIYYL